MQKKHSFILLVVVIAVSLFLSNPTQSTYLSKISYEFTSHHSEYEVPENALRKIGTHKRVSYLLFSTYTHRFGQSKMYYFGIANNVFYLGSRHFYHTASELKVV